MMDAEEAERYALGMKRLRLDLDIIAQAIENNNFKLATIAALDMQAGVDHFTSSITETWVKSCTNDEEITKLFADILSMVDSGIVAELETELERRGLDMAKWYHYASE